MNGYMVDIQLLVGPGAYLDKIDSTLAVSQSEEIKKEKEVVRKTILLIQEEVDISKVNLKEEEEDEEEDNEENDTKFKGLLNQPMGEDRWVQEFDDTY